MSNIREAIRLISGKEPTQEQVQRVQAIAHSCGFSASDAMMPILIALDSYHAAFSELPARAQQAADSIAENTERETRLVVEKTVVGALVPVAERAFENGVSKYTTKLERAAAHKSLGFVAVAAVGVLLAGFAAGWSGGSWWRGNDDQEKVERALKAQDGVEARIATQIAADNKLIAAANSRADAVAATANASNEWARTQQGRLAYQFFVFGNGEAAAQCSPGLHWQKMKSADGKNVCVPQHKGFFGWSPGGEGWVIP